MIYTRSQKSTTITLVFSIFVAALTLNGVVKPWEPLPVAHAEEASDAIPPPEDGGPIPIDTDGDGVTDGWDVDGDGKIDVEDKNGNGEMDQDEEDEILSIESAATAADNECRLGKIKNYSGKLQIIGTFLVAAGPYVMKVGGLVGIVIGAIMIVVGFLLKWLGGRKNYTKELYKVYYRKEYQCDPEVRMDATVLFQAMANRILVTITSGGEISPYTDPGKGRGGGTTWVRDWQAFVQVKRGEGKKHFQWMLYDAAINPNTATMCPYFAEEIAAAFHATPNVGEINSGGNWVNGYYRIGAEQPFDIRVKCTLPDDFDMNAYSRGDTFSWALYDLLNQPQNNPMGVWLMAVEEEQRQIANNESINREDLVANQGFRGIRAQDGTGTNTPGSVLSQLAAKTIGSQLDYLLTADEFGELFDDAYLMVGLTVNRTKSLLNEQLVN